MPVVSGIMQYLFFYTWLISFSIMSFKFIYVVGYSRISFYLRQNIIILYVYIISPLSIYPSMSIYVLSISRLLWITLQCWSADKFLRFSIHLDIYAEMGLLDHMTIFNFLTNFCIFFIVITPFYIPKNSVQGSNFSKVLATFATFLLVLFLIIMIPMTMSITFIR